MGFPGKADPDAWDFLYASFTIGMTAQVSDVEVDHTARCAARCCCMAVASFFYNTGILALAVNAAGDGRAVGRLPTGQALTKPGRTCASLRVPTYALLKAR